MSLKPTPEQVREWVEHARAYAKAQPNSVLDSIGYDGCVQEKLAELAVAWGAEQAASQDAIDAKLYRWLREDGTKQYFALSKVRTLNGDDFDAVIAAAMAKEQP